MSCDCLHPAQEPRLRDFPVLHFVDGEELDFAGAGGVLMMSALFGVLCLCLVRCPRQFYVAKTLLTLAVLLGLMFEVQTFMSLRPNYGRMWRMYITNLKQIEGAKANWALEEHKTTNYVPTAADLYGADRYIRVEPRCPLDGVYTIGRV